MIEPIKEMERIVAQISHKYSPEKIILFGSLATGHAAEARDIDLLVYTPEEINARIEMHDFFILDIMEHGKVVYERNI